MPDKTRVMMTVAIDVQAVTALQEFLDSLSLSGKMSSMRHGLIDGLANVKKGSPTGENLPVVEKPKGNGKGGNE